MDFNTYQELSGITVPSSNVTRVTSQITRTRSILEMMLGFTLNPKKVEMNLYNELGKTTLECSCSSVDTEDLDPADDVIGSYRLYRYNPLDKFFFTDPFEQLNSVKLVYLKQGEEPNGVTLKTYEVDEIRIQALNGGWSKYIQPIKNFDCGCDNVQLAIDANWMFDECLPEELKYVWVDMITYYSDLKNNIKNESINSHSYTKFDNKTPQELTENLNIIKRYAGPYGSVNSEPTIGVK